MTETYTFQAEIQQLLDILVHSLYTEQEIFLRELVSNASDALNRVQFEQLTNHDVLDPDAELAIEIKPDEEAGTLTISDSGIGMTRDDLMNNIGVIARSGAKAFIQAMKDKPDGAAVHDVIGQFGVGFYSVFMVADKVRVVSRSHHLDGQAWAWESDGGNEYTIEEAEREERGTDIIITLKEDAKAEFTQTWKLKNIVTRHSDYVSFPIYIGDDEEPANSQTAIWRKDKGELEDEDYNNFYQQMTLDFEPPSMRIHMKADVPIQFYALLYIQGSAERPMFSPRKEPGLKLYARKVLIQEYNKDLLPEYLNQFVQGVVDSEDLPLSVSRESVQATRVMATLKKTLTNKVLSELKRLAKKDTPAYLDIFHKFGHMLKQGLAIEPASKDDLVDLLYFQTSFADGKEDYYALADYVQHMADGQKDIYYIVADDYHSAAASPHLEPFTARGIPVLYFTQQVDPIMLMGLTEYNEHKLRSVDEADLDLSEIGELSEDEAEDTEDALPEDTFQTIIKRFESVLGDSVTGVKTSTTLVSSPARLVGAEGNNHMFRVNRLFERDSDLPVKTLELNPRHPLLHNLNGMVQAGADEAMINDVVQQIFETALLQDGIHPDPASMASRLHKLMQAATNGYRG